MIPEDRGSPRANLVPAAAVAFLVAAAMAVIGRAVASDEEALRYQLARWAFDHPENLLSIMGRPLVTTGLALPAQLGFVAARLGSALITGLAGLAVARLVARAGWLPPVWAAVFLVAQPVFLAYSGTIMTEPWAACMVAWGVVAVVERRPWLLALMAALLPTARLELGVMLLPAGLLLLAWRRWLPILVLPMGLVVWNGLAGWVHGDPLWLLHLEPRPYPEREALHYVKSFVWIVGAGVFVPMLVGMAWSVGALVRSVGSRRTEPAFEAEAPPEFQVPDSSVGDRTLIVSLAVTAIVTLLYTYLATWRPMTYGNLRYLAFASAPLALMGVGGIHVLVRDRAPWVWGVLVVAVAGAAGLWNHPVHAGSDILGARTWIPLIAAVLWLGVYVAPRRPVILLGGLAVLLTLGDLVAQHQGTLHLRETPEQAGAARAADRLAAMDADATLLYAHPLLHFYAGEDPFRRQRWLSVDADPVRDAAPGTLWFWDSHYTPRPGLAFSGTEVGSGTSAGWRYLDGVVASDSSWSGAFFARGNGPTGGATLPHPEWLRATEFVEAGAGYALRAAEADPSNPERWQRLADRLASVGRLPEAWRALDRAESLAPDDPRNAAVRAYLLFNDGQLDAALASVRGARETYPEDAYLQFLEGQILWEAGEKAEAFSLVLGAEERLKDRWDVSRLAADMLYEAGDWGRARFYYLITVSLRPSQELAWLRGAECAAKVGRADKAEETLTRMVTQYPGWASGYLALGDLLQGTGREAEAREVWRAGAENTGSPELQRRLR